MQQRQAPFIGWLPQFVPHDSMQRGLRKALTRGLVRGLVIAAAWTPALLLFAELAEPGTVVVLLEP